jgi:hypothetical protein
LNAPRDAFWNGLLALSLAAILIIAIVGFSSAKRVAPNSRNEARRVSAATLREHEAREKAEVVLASRTWSAKPESLASLALAQLTELAEKSHLQLAEFRSEKLQEVAGLTQFPFTAVVSGRYPDFVAFLHSLESEQSKLMVGLLQLSSADNRSDRVSATMSLSAFRLKETQ